MKAARMKLHSALAIGGSSPDGGAGIQMDTKTLEALGVYSASAVTAVTAQNTQGVVSVFPVPAEVVAEQISVVLSDIAVGAVKIGMLGSADVALAVAGALARFKAKNIVFDPVMSAQAGGAALADEEARAAMRKLAGMSAFVTPNADEALALTGVRVKDVASARKAAQKLRGMGAKNVVVTGVREGKNIVDVALLKEGFVAYEKKWLNTGTHGGGCALSSAIAAGLAKGMKPAEALDSAEEFIRGAIKGARKVGKGIEVVMPREARERK